MTSTGRVTVFGAYGHTGRFTVSELRRRGWMPILSGRDPEKLKILAAHGGLEIRPASVDVPASLDGALAGASAVINCAGPVAFTAAPLIEAAMRAHIPYLDVAAEVEVAAAAFERYAGRARAAGTLIVPSMGFYGGLGDLLATAAMGDWPRVDEICVAYALNSWKPTQGTRATIETSKQRRGGRRLVFANHQLELRTDETPIVEWTFPAPIGTQRVVGEFTTPDSVTMARHLRTSEIRTYMMLASLKDLSDPDLSPPRAIDESGRSSQTFLVETVLRLNGAQRRAVPAAVTFTRSRHRSWWKRLNASSTIGSRGLVSSRRARSSTHESFSVRSAQRISRLRFRDSAGLRTGKRNGGSHPPLDPVDLPARSETRRRVSLPRAF